MGNEQGAKLKALLFLEGRSIPLVNAICTTKKGRPNTATIEIAPLREIADILPRTMVHIMVKDFTYKGEVKPWILMYEGEVYGYGLGKSTQERSFTLYAMDISNYWDNAKQHYMNFKSSSGDMTSTRIFDKSRESSKMENIDIVHTIGGLRAYITDIITKKLNAGADLIEAVVEVIKRVEDVNPFFRYANARYRINDRIIFKSSGSIKNLFDLKNKEDFIDAFSGRGNGGIITIRQVISYIMSLAFHDFVSVSVPSKVNKPSLAAVSTGKTFVTAVAGEDIVTEKATGIGKNNLKTIGSFIFKPDTFMLPPPKCNVLFPDQYSNANFTRNFFNEVTRTKFQPSLPSLHFNSDQKSSYKNYATTFMETLYSPSGFSKYRKAEQVPSSETEQFEPASDDMGNFQDDAKDVIKTSTVLQDYHFLSKEEVLKGIFSDLNMIMPSAQILAQVLSGKEKKSFYQQATDYLFFKKRYASRSFSTSGPLNLAPVPGFTILLLDDSEAEQHIIGVLDEIIHKVDARSGGYTTYQIGFSRRVEEKDLWSGKASEPPIPPWYSAKTFGKRRKVKLDDYRNLFKVQQERVKTLGVITDFGNSDLREYYESLLGASVGNSHRGSLPITSKKHPGLLAATLHLLNQYRYAKKQKYLRSFINRHTRRDYVTMHDTFKFLGATNWSSRVDFTSRDTILFKGHIFDGGFVDRAKGTENARDAALKSLFGKQATDKRRAPINAYRRRILRERGFRG